MTDLDHLFMYVGMLLTALTVLSHGLQLLGSLLVKLAAETTTDTDDKIANGVLAGAISLADFLDRVAAVIPAVRRK